jgi:hypothetical protein
MHFVVSVTRVARPPFKRVRSNSGTTIVEWWGECGECDEQVGFVNILKSVKSSGGVGLIGTAATSKGELKIEDGEWCGAAGAAE